MKNLFLLAALTLFTLNAPTVSAAVITLNANDTSGIRSYNAAGNWSNSLAPSAGNDYSVSGRILYGPGTQGTHIFAGNSLTLTSGGLLVANAANGQTLQVNNLTLNGGSLNNFSGAAVFSGTMTLIGSANTFRVTTTRGAVTISAKIMGTGGVIIAADGPTSVPQLSITNSNTFSGGTTLSNYVPVVATSDGAFGSGFVRILGGTLTLQSGVTNDYIGDSSTLFLASGLAAGSVNLAYSGADAIGQLSFDNGATFANSGTWGAVGSGATYESAIFTGSGFLNVVPEPSTVALIAAAVLVPLATRRRKYRRS
jgi:hypothetical protein